MRAYKYKQNSPERKCKQLTVKGNAKHYQVNIHCGIHSLQILQLVLWEHLLRLPIIKYLSIILFLTGLIISAGSCLQRKALVGPEEWTVVGPAELHRGLDRYTISRDIFESKDRKLWSNYSNAQFNSVKVASEAFNTPRYLSFLYAEGQNSLHNFIYLECLETQKKIYPIIEHTNGSLVERTIKIDLSECGPQARLWLESDSPYFAAISTPYKANIFHYLKYSTLTAGFHFQLAFVAFILFYLFCYVINKNLPRKYYRPWGTIVWFGLLSYLLFFSFWISKELSYTLITLSFMYGIYRLRQKKLLQRFLRENFKWLLMLYGFGLSLSMLLWLKDSGNFNWLASTRFDPAIWSSDNQLPAFTLKALINAEPLKNLFGNWEITDRPPLYTGALGIGALVWEIFRQIGLGDLGIPVMFAYGLILNSLWLFPLYYWRRVFHLRQEEFTLLVILLFSTGFIVFNTVYTWPKLLTVFFVFPAFILTMYLFKQKRVSETSLFFTVVGGALAIQTHGGVIFSLLAITLLVLKNYRFIYKNFSILSKALVAVILIMLPWSLFKGNVLASSDPLTKFALAGTFGWETDLTAIELIREKYQSLSGTQWLNKKILGLKNWVGYFEEINYNDLFQNNSILGIIRKIQQTSIIPALLPFGFALISLFFLKVRNRLGTTRLPLLALFYIGTGGVIINLFMTWSHHVVGHNAYPSLFSLLLASVIIVINLFPRRLAIGIGLLSATPWVIAGLFTRTHIPILSQVLVVFIIYSVISTISSLDNSHDFKRINNQL